LKNAVSTEFDCNTKAIIPFLFNGINQQMHLQSKKDAEPKAGIYSNEQFRKADWQCAIAFLNMMKVMVQG